jgi:hypothetical protein
MTPFGNRDVDGTPPFEDRPDPSDRRWLDLDQGRTADVIDEVPTMRSLSPDTRRVIIRVHGGEDIEIGRTEGREPAVRMARDMIRSIEDAQTRGDWPQIAERFVRPGAIVSIDVQRS